MQVAVKGKLKFGREKWKMDKEKNRGEGSNIMMGWPSITFSLVLSQSKRPSYPFPARSASAASHRLHRLRLICCRRMTGHAHPLEVTALGEIVVGVGKDLERCLAGRRTARFETLVLKVVRRDRLKAPDLPSNRSRLCSCKERGRR